MFDERQPPGVAVGHDVDRASGSVVDLLDDSQSVPADRSTGCDVLFGKGFGERLGCGDTLCAVLDPEDRGELPPHRPRQVDRRRTARLELSACLPEILVGIAGTHLDRRQGGQVHAVSGGDPYAAGAPHHHVGDHLGHLGRRPDRHLDVLERQQPLVDGHHDGRIGLVDPDRATGRRPAHSGTAAT